ncbi:MAG: alpha/beta hydrolase [Myxococcaceae bacterium]|nr:alpha/beta hydrolase [Myxococcaceae bacterium]MCA3015992.1 alpha/beta hydrolase [Myxococcaceae bacterium]
MHFVEKGTGPVVLLLHGFPEMWWSWRYQVDALAAAGFRVVVPDQRGYGETDKHGPYDLDTLAADVCHLVEHLGGARRVRVVGHDWGGAVAWHLAAHRPEFCERLAVLNCPHPAVMRQALLNGLSWAQVKRSWYMFFFQLPLLPEWLLTRNDAEVMPRTLKAASARRDHWTPDDVRPFRDAILRPGAATAMVGWYRAAVRFGFRHPFSPPRYPPITCEATLLWGLNDPALDFDVLVPGTERYAPRLRVVRVPEAGHFVHSEAPEAVNPALVSFLSERPPVNTSTGTS